MTETTAQSPIEMLLTPPVRDLGEGFTVRRALPAPKRRMVGPFVFLDRMGPTRLPAGHGLDVRPHPHIGLATVTYLLSGEILHRDSLGTTQVIRPGAVNWMTAGRGIVHSERTPESLRSAGPSLSGVQIWVALPADQEETAPSFVHYPAAALPELSGEGFTLRLIAGTVDGQSSPVKTASPMLCADVAMSAEAHWRIPTEHEERAIFVLSGEVMVVGADKVVVENELAIFTPGAEVVLHALSASRFMLITGEPLGKRYVYWNFVSSRPERIEQAKRDWSSGKFDAVDGEPDVIPLPDEHDARIRLK